MATPVLKPEYIKMIPEFSGDIELLPRFISICEKLVVKFYNNTDPTDFQNDYLMDSILSKVKGDAQKNISSCVLNSWNDLKQALVSTYADKRDVHTLVIEMCSMKQTNDSVFDFYNKIQKMVNLQTSFITTHNVAGNEHLKKFVSDLGLRTLLRGLKDPLGSLMRTKNPRDLNEALNILINDFQIETTPSAKNNTQSQTNNRYIPPHFRQNNINHGNYSNNNNHNNNNNRNTNNNNNFNRKQNSTVQSVNRNNSFGQSNVFGRQNQFPRPLPAPTPMSIVQSRNANLHNIEDTPEDSQAQTFNEGIESAAENYDFPEANPDQDFYTTASEEQQD